MSKPAHKSGTAGQVVYPVGEPHCVGGRTDAPVKKKLTFREWYNSEWKTLPDGSDALEECWKAAQENK